MREIKFRGKRVDNGEWAYGYYAVHKMMLTGEMDYFIIVNEQRPQSVDPKTVGEFTGLKDRNGKEIYEGDIVTSHDTGIHFDKDDFTVEVVEWYAFGWSPFMNVIGGARHDYAAKIKEYIVIGNINENHELITKED